MEGLPGLQTLNFGCPNDRISAWALSISYAWRDRVHRSFGLRPYWETSRCKKRNEESSWEWRVCAQRSLKGPLDKFWQACGKPCVGGLKRSFRWIPPQCGVVCYTFFFEVGNWQLDQEFTGKILSLQPQAVNQETRMMWRKWSATTTWSTLSTSTAPSFGWTCH